MSVSLGGNLTADQTTFLNQYTVSGTFTPNPANFLCLPHADIATFKDSAIDGGLFVHKGIISINVFKPDDPAACRFHYQGRCHGCQISSKVYVIGEDRFNCYDQCEFLTGRGYLQSINDPSGSGECFDYRYGIDIPFCAIGTKTTCAACTTGYYVDQDAPDESTRCKSVYENFPFCASVQSSTGKCNKCVAGYKLETVGEEVSCILDDASAQKPLTPTQVIDTDANTLECADIIPGCEECGLTGSN
jgi:hypothetical protein